MPSPPSLTSIGAQRWGTASGPVGTSGVSYNAGDILVFFGGCFNSGGSPASLTPSGLTGVTWSRHTFLVNGTLRTDLWAGIAASTQSGQTLSVSQSLGSQQAAYGLAAITGATGFDTNANAQQSAFGHTISLIDTDLPDDLVFIGAFQASTATQVTTPAGWNAGPGINSTTTNGGVHCAWKTFSAAQSDLSATYGSTSNAQLQSDAFTADAIPNPSLKRSQGVIIW